MKVHWDDEISNIWKNRIHVPNHQPVMVYYPSNDRLVEKIHHFFTPPGMPWCPRTSSYTAGSTCMEKLASWWFLVFITEQLQIYPGWWFQSLWKIWKSVGMMKFPIYGKSKQSCSKPPTSIYNKNEKGMSWMIKERHEFRHHFRASHFRKRFKPTGEPLWHFIWVDQCCGSAEMLWTTDLYTHFFHMA